MEKCLRHGHAYHELLTYLFNLSWGILHYTQYTFNIFFQYYGCTAYALNHNRHYTIISIHIM